MQSFSRKNWLLLLLFGTIGQIAWSVENMFFGTFVYESFKDYNLADGGLGTVTLMVQLSGIVATVVTLIAGTLSDKLGKRKIFICGGYILWGVSIFSFVFIRLDVINAVFPAIVSAASVGVSLVIILDCVMTFFGSTANDAAFNAWLTDSTDSTNRGSAEGINAMMPLVAILVVFGGFMFFDLSKTDSWTYIFSIISPR